MWPCVPNPSNSTSCFCDSVLHIVYSPVNRACSHVYQIHQTPPAAFVGFSTPQYSPANRACSHVYQIHQIHQTPPAAFVDSVLHIVYSPVNRACSHVYQIRGFLGTWTLVQIVYQIHQTPPAAFVGFSTPQYSSANRACSHVYQIHQTPPAAFVGFSAPQYSPVLDSGLFIAKPWMLCICYCTNPSPTPG